MFSKNKSLPAYIYLYVLCQSINLTAAVISVTVAATIGDLIAPTKSLATLPYGTQFLCLLLATYPIAILMEKKGRKAGFYIGAAFLALSGLVGFWAVSKVSFIGLIVAHGLLGTFTACANYYRFAAVDNLNNEVKSKALSLVVAGGLLAGIIGPMISTYTRDVQGFQLFSWSYGVLILLSLFNVLLLMFIPQRSKNKQVQKESDKQFPLKKTQTNQSYIIFAIMSAAVGCGLMNLIMIQSSLQMHDMGIEFDHSASAIQWHVVAMFVPSFLSGFLISKLGHKTLVSVGFILFLAVFIINITSIAYSSIFVSLIVLGLAWNFCYVGGSSYLAILVSSGSDGKRWQGLGDTAIAVLAMLGAMLPAVFSSTIGWKGSNYLCLFIALLCLSVSVFLMFAKRKN